MYISIGIAGGAVIGWLIGKAKATSMIQSEKDAAQQRYIELDKEFVSFKATSVAELHTANSRLSSFDEEIKLLKGFIETQSADLSVLNKQISIANVNLNSTNQLLQDKNKDLEVLKVDLIKSNQEFIESQQRLASAKAQNEALNIKASELIISKEEIKKIQLQLNNTGQSLATANANNAANLRKLQDFDDLKIEHKQVLSDFAETTNLYHISKSENDSLAEKISLQKTEMETVGKKFNLEFENIANKILETKSERFTKLNSENLKTILEPLGQNITEFKKQVDEVYKAESQERFSLGEKVKELSQLNKLISEEAHNLTKALKGESKTQGRWGEMILESILERSGLVKNREFFMEHELLDDDGKPMKSDSEGKKMRPDAVVKYPDNRNVIIDSKVSLNAFTRLVDAVDVDVQNTEIKAHISSIKSHIINLSSKGYDDYNKSLDFVMLFVPSEPAYIAALQHDPELWNYAYDRRILLLSPTNLITSLKLIVDLWKREYQNQNSVAIAKRGELLYSKFVGFVDNITNIGKGLKTAQDSYDNAFSQLSTGPGNLINQASELKKLKVASKKTLADSLVINALIGNEVIE